MLSRKMRGEIREMLEALDEGLVCRSFVRRAAMLQDGMAALSAFRSVFQAGMGAERFAYYEEVLEGLLRALQVLQRTDSEEITALSHELLRWLMDEIGKEPVKKEIVFLPYKASMWDSLESIWQAAIADGENCNAYVVPIPYATLTPEREVKEWHCEKDIFPSYVPVIDYRDIDLEALHPDVIFIHNPFDGGNFVTSVAVEYYSDRLKMYTDKLVYVPYFVSGNFVGQDSRVFPAIINADHVIVESEAIKAQYEAGYLGGSPPAGKFLALGSPKYDKVRTGTKADHPIPAAWQRMIADRKVILYNTSLEPALAHSDKVCAKLEEVFDFFRHQRDIVLWWRPHPLMKDTFDSLRSEIAAAYREIEQRYIEGSWGIYDDSPDVTRAVIWADAYYGDSSSVMCLYQATGRPSMMQNISFADSTRKALHPHMGYVSIEDEQAWFIGEFGKWQALYSLDLNTHAMNYYGEIPSSHEYWYAYLPVQKIHEKLLIAPYYSYEGIIEYDISAGKFTKLDIGCDLQHDRLKSEVVFSNAVRYKESVFFLSDRSSGAILEYRYSSGDYVWHKSWRRVLPEGFAYEDIKVLVQTARLRDGKWFFAIYRTNIIVAFDLENFSARRYDIPLDIQAYHILLDGKSIYVLSEDNVFVHWNLADNSVRTARLSHAQEAVLIGLIKSEKGIMGVPYKGSGFVFYDSLKQCMVDDVDCDKLFFADGYDASLIKFTFVHDLAEMEKTFFFDYEKKALVEYDRRLRQFIQHDVCVPEEWAEEIVSHTIQHSDIIPEHAGFSLAMFLRGVFRRARKVRDTGAPCHLSDGDRIYAQICR